MAQIDELLEQAEVQDGANSWTLITKYQHKEFYVDSDRAVNVVGRKIEAIREDVSVQGENHSQYIEFIMDRYYDGIDLAEQTLAIHYEVGDTSDEDAPINVYKNDTQIKFGWVVKNNLTQYATTIEFCIWARGTLLDGNSYILKTLPQKYEIQRGLTLAGGIIEPSENWYLQFATTMDEKVAQAATSADRAIQSASAISEVERTVALAQQDVTEKASAVNAQHIDVNAWHQEVKQFRDETEQFRNQAEAITGIGLAKEGKPGLVQPDGVTTQVDVEGKLIVIGGGSGGEGTTDYEALENKPSIAGVELSGDKSYDELGLVSKETIASNFETVNQELRVLDEFTQALDKDISSLDDEFERVNKELQSTMIKVDTIIEKAELGIKETATGESVRLIDSSGSKIVELSLFGKATQKITSGKNLLPNKATTQTVNGVTFTVNEDGSVTVEGTATANAFFNFIGVWESTENFLEIGENYILSGSGSSNVTIVGSYNSAVVVSTDASDKQFTNSSGLSCVYLRVNKDVTVNNVTVYPMIRLASVLDVTYEPYTGGMASPNPDYPQEIKVAGAGGSVVVTTTNEDMTKNTMSTISTPNGLSGIPVSSGGNYIDSNGQQWICDEIVKYADGSGEYIRRVGKYVFDDAVTFYKNGVIFNTNVATDRSTTNRVAMCSNHKNIVDKRIGNFATADTYLKNGEFALRNAGEQDFYTVYFKNTSITTTADFKAMMLGSEIYYELAESITTPLTVEEIAEIEKLSTFYPVTNISNDSDCGMKVTYVVDAKNYIDNKLAQIAMAVVNSI